MGTPPLDHLGRDEFITLLGCEEAFRRARRHTGFQSIWNRRHSQSKAAKQAGAAGGERSSPLGTGFASRNGLIHLIFYLKRYLYPVISGLAEAEQMNRTLAPSVTV